MTGRNGLVAIYRIDVDSHTPGGGVETSADLVCGATSLLNSGNVELFAGDS
jgi:hypothetical protein